MFEKFLEKNLDDVVVCIEYNSNGEENYTEQTVRDILGYNAWIEDGRVQQINWDIEVNSSMVPFVRSAEVIFI